MCENVFKRYGSLTFEITNNVFYIFPLFPVFLSRQETLIAREVIYIEKRQSIKSKEILRMGIDLSIASTGYCIANKDFNRVTTGLIKTRPETSDIERIMSIWTDLIVTIEGSPNFISEVAIEGLAISLRGQRALQLAGLHYYFLIQAKKHLDIPVRVVPPTSLKQFVTGKGRCQKNLMLMKCYKRWGFEADNDDICDAYCLTRYCWEVNDGGTSKAKQSTSDRKGPKKQKRKGTGKDKV